MNTLVDATNAGALVTSLLDLVRVGDADLTEVETGDVQELVQALNQVLESRHEVQAVVVLMPF